MVLRRRRKSDIPRAGPFPPGWDVPARFNFTRDVVEVLGAGDAQRKGVAYVDSEGIVDRRTFADVAKDAARWAHLLRTRVDRGDRKPARLRFLGGESADIDIVVGFEQAGAVVAH